MDSIIKFEKDIINSLSIGIIVASQQGKIIFINKAIREMTGYKRTEIKTMDDWYKKACPDPEYRKKVKDYFQYDSADNTTDRTYKIITAAGDHKYFNFRYSKLENEKMLFEIIDISHRIAQKRKLENQKLIFENLFTNSLEGIVLLDKRIS